MLDLKYCEDCAFFIEAPEHITTSSKLQFGHCSKVKIEINSGYHLVSRQFPAPVEMPFASLTRINASGCGPDAKWFAPKPSIQEAAE